MADGVKRLWNIKENTKVNKLLYIAFLSVFFPKAKLALIEIVFICVVNQLAIEKFFKNLGEGW